MRHVAVIGGGVAGLAAAHRLKLLSEREGRPVGVTVLEASDRFGGKIRTDRSEGVVIEAGPDSFLTVKPDAIALARQLGLGDRIIPTAQEARDVYVFARGRLRRFPEGLLLMAPTRIRPFLVSDIVTWRGKLRMALERFLPAGGQDDESLADFTRRRLGREALDTIVDPMMAGIYAGDAESLSLKSTFPQFPELERRYGSVIRGLRATAKAKPPGTPALTPFASLAGGLEELVEGLVRSLGMGSLRSRAPVQSLRRAGQGYEVAAGGGALRADSVILALPAADAAAALQAADPYLAGLLREIPAVSTATVTLAFNSDAIPSLPKGFGFVVPRTAGRSISAAT
ncbi:MAG: protoporphyrinogen oxidase, partial [Elusimicrobia bacterium]|nr:protoporphyrinogen oxidase [Elusimicrobiota bacterium]